MRIALSLLNIIGVNGVIVDNEAQELVAGWFLVPEDCRKLVLKKFTESKVYPVNEDTAQITRINPSYCFLDSEIKIDSPYKASKMLYINQSVSFKNAALEKQYFLIKKVPNKVLTDEEIEVELKRQFFSKALQKLPLPIHQDWEEYIWTEIKSFFTPLSIFGKCPYQKAFVMKLPNVTRLQELVEFSHKSHEFKTKFKRVPQLKSIILGVNDINNFNFKDWQTMLELVGGIEEFKKLSFEHQKSIVQAFEILGPVKETYELKNVWHATNIKSIGIMLRIEQDKNRKQALKILFTKLLEMFIENKSYLYPAINSFEKLVKEEEINIKNGNIGPIKAFLDKMVYENVIVGAEELAVVCSNAKVSDSEYKLYEEQYLSHLDDCLVSAKSYPTIKSSLSSNSTVLWELLDMSVPRAWVVGTETHCCMHPNSCGGACLLYAAKNPRTSGILRLEAKGKTVAQSFMWLSEPDESGFCTMVLDNIEVSGLSDISDLSKSSSKSFVIDAYKDFAERMEFYSRLFKIKAITIGTGFSDLDLSSFCEKKLSNSDKEYGKIPRTLNYTDANTQWLFKSFKQKQEK